MGIHFVKHLKVHISPTFVDKVCSSNVIVNPGGSTWE
jgi:hypothetical protein